ncbi:MAG: aldo/keto reductase [Algisphaera sp.]
MKYRRFGRTELQMPVISTGGMRYQDGWTDKPLAEMDPAIQANLEAVIRYSVEVGINHIETARGYGASERQLGVVLPTFARDELIVQTKVAPVEDADAFTAQFMESLDRLQLDYVDLLGIHGLNNDETIDQTVRPGGCLQAARALQKKGLCRHVGFSTHAPLKQLLQAINTDVYGGFDYVNLHYYYIFQRNQAAVAAAAARDMGVFIISPNDKGGKLYDAPAKVQGFCAPLHPIEFNNLWTLRDERVHTLSLGAARIGDYDLALSSVEKMPQTEEIVPGIEKKWTQAMTDAIGHASPEAMSWDGVPEHYDMPSDLNLPIVLWLRNLAVGWDMVEYGKMRFNMFGQGGHWFPGTVAKDIGAVSAQEIAQAVKRSPFAKDIPGWVADAVERLLGEAGKRMGAGD